MLIYLLMHLLAIPSSFLFVIYIFRTTLHTSCTRNSGSSAIRRWHNSLKMWGRQVFLCEALTYGHSGACQHPREALCLQHSPPSLTVAWKNNSTWKTIKTILTKFLKMDSQLLESICGLRCGENMTCRKSSKSSLLGFRSEHLISEFPPGFTRHSCLCQRMEYFPEPHYSSSIMEFNRCCS